MPNWNRIAHSASKVTGKVQTMVEHLLGVEALTLRFLGTHFPPQHVREVSFASRGHDIGKYSPLFPDVLNGVARGVLDHSSPGAWVAYDRGSLLASLLIAGHHRGLPDFSRVYLGCVLRPSAQPMGSGTHPNPGVFHVYPGPAKDLLVPLREDGIELPEININDDETFFSFSELVKGWQLSIAKGLDVRMAFSALVDADFLDTAEHFKPGRTCPNPPLDAGLALDVLNKYIDGLSAKSKRSDGASPVVQQERDRLRQDCLRAAQGPPGRILTCTAPTGVGKTLALVSFALAHCQAHQLKRVIIAVPYKSIIQQTAKTLKELFKDRAFGPHFVLEHHTDATQWVEEEDLQQDGRSNEIDRRGLTENWDAPIILTTNVQLLESLFSNRPGRCRKLHNIQDCVIIFDEGQSLPSHLMLPTIAMLDRLSRQYQVTVVSATATQPAFQSILPQVETLVGEPLQPYEEIASAPVASAKAMVRNKFHWPHNDDERWTWAQLADRVCSERMSNLVLLNRKDHAEAAWREIQTRWGADRAIYLTSNLCPAHRKGLLKEVVRRLKTVGDYFVLAATPCVNSGTDFDFNRGFPAMGPLDGTAQTAGRVNREGLRVLGDIFVFRPDVEYKDMFPHDEWFQAAARITERFLRRYGQRLDPTNPEILTQYYEALYREAGLDHPATKKIIEAYQEGSFEKVSRRYRVIPDKGVQVVVPYLEGGCGEQYRKLNKERPTRKSFRMWMNRAALLSVSVLSLKKDHPLWLSLDPVTLKRKDGSITETGWYICTDPRAYHPELGLVQ